MKLWAGMFLLLIAMRAEARPAAWQKGLIEIRADQQLYVEYRKAQRGKPTLFLLNGLTWTTRDWNRFVTALDKIDSEIGLVLYDMQGMGQTLRLNPLVRYEIPIENQVEDLKNLKRKLGIRGPTAVSGLSYGGGVALLYMAKYPRDFDQVIAFAPFIERLTDQDQILNAWIDSHRLLYPFDPRSQEELYDHYLRVLIYSTYPIAEPVLLENPYKLEATYRMVQGAKNFQAMDLIDRFPRRTLHLVAALSDDFVKEPRLAEFWEKARERAASYLRLAHTEHKIPFERPEIAASWVQKILSGHPEISHGRVFEGDPFKAEARSGDTVIGLKKAGFCESLLRRVFRTF